jgi:hypothetical protein
MISQVIQEDTGCSSDEAHLLGVGCGCSHVPRSNSDRVRVENARCRSIRVLGTGADDVRTVFWRTTGSKAGARPCDPDLIEAAMDLM